MRLAYFADPFPPRNQFFRGRYLRVCQRGLTALGTEDLLLLRIPIATQKTGAFWIALGSDAWRGRILFWIWIWILDSSHLSGMGSCLCCTMKLASLPFALKMQLAPWAEEFPCRAHLRSDVEKSQMRVYRIVRPYMCTLSKVNHCNTSKRFRTR